MTIVFRVYRLPGGLTVSYCPVGSDGQGHLPVGEAFSTIKPWPVGVESREYVWLTSLIPWGRSPIRTFRLGPAVSVPEGSARASFDSAFGKSEMQGKVQRLFGSAWSIFQPPQKWLFRHVGFATGYSGG